MLFSQIGQGLQLRGVDPSQARASGDHAQVRLLLGINADRRAWADRCALPIGRRRLHGKGQARLQLLQQLAGWNHA